MVPGTGVEPAVMAAYKTAAVATEPPRHEGAFAPVKTIYLFGTVTRDRTWTLSFVEIYSNPIKLSRRILLSHSLVGKYQARTNLLDLTLMSHSES